MDDVAACPSRARTIRAVGPESHETQRHQSEPPIEDGEIRDVTIGTLGEQGDIIAKAERGYVVVTPGAQPGDAPTVGIWQARPNVAFANVVGSDPRRLKPHLHARVLSCPAPALR